MKLEGNGADCNRLAAWLAAADPLTADIDEMEKVAGELRRKRQANLKASVALLQARLALLPEVNSDRHAAETAAAADLESARESVSGAECATWVSAGGLRAATPLSFNNVPSQSRSRTRYELPENGTRRSRRARCVALSSASGRIGNPAVRRAASSGAIRGR